MISYERTNTQIKTMYEQLRNAGIGLDIGLDFSKLPPFSAFAKYLRSTGRYAVPYQHAVSIEVFSLRKK